MQTTTILYIIIIVLVISNLFFIWRGTRLVKELEDRAKSYQSLITYYSTSLEQMLSEMRSIDIRGSFESDDEVGIVFKELKSTIEKYKKEI